MREQLLDPRPFRLRQPRAVEEPELRQREIGVEQMRFGKAYKG